MKTTFRIGGMSCAACSAHVEKSARGVPGVSQAQVNLLAGSMVAEYDDTKCTAADIIAAVEQGGYTAALKDEMTGAAAAEPQTEELQRMKVRVIGSFAFLIVLMIFSMGPMLGLPLPQALSGEAGALYLALLQLVLTLPILLLNRVYYSRGIKTLLHGAPTMDALIAIGSGAALLYGLWALAQIGLGQAAGDTARVHAYMHDLYFESAGMIVTLVTLGKYFETRAKRKTGEAIAALVGLRPQTATVRRDGQEQEIPAEDVVLGDLVVVRAGQSVPVDGEIVEGRAAVDESALTGESMPVEKKTGDTVIGATVSKSGFFVCRVTRVGEDTTLSQMVRLVEEAGSSKAPIAKLADRVAGVFVPVVIGIALLTLAIWLLVGQTPAFAISRAITVLVISCPCALGLATPVAIMVATGVGAKNGVLFRSAEALERLHTVQAVVLDKTGTVTAGEPTVTDVIPLGMERAPLLSLALSLEEKSQHPLADAIVRYTRQNGGDAAETTDFETIEGQGVRATIGGTVCMAGNRRMLLQNGLVLSAHAEEVGEALAAQGKTPLYFAASRQLAGIFAIADVIKPTSRSAVQALQALGLSVTLLTGDNRVTAEEIAGMLGIDDVVAEVLPQDKERIVREKQEQGAATVMVGDGINDAPALARADVGIAIGAGTDVAIQSADVVLMKSDLMDCVNAIRLSQATMRNIRQNLFWAFFYNIIGIPIAAGVFYAPFGLTLNPMIGAAAMSLSSFCVVMNALRLRFFKPLTASADPEDTPMIMIQQKEDITMKKTIKIEGMMCKNCVAHVEKALTAAAGVQPIVSLESGTAVLEGAVLPEDAVLRAAVEDAGYQVVEIV